MSELDDLKKRLADTLMQKGDLLRECAELREHLDFNARQVAIHVAKNTEREQRLAEATALLAELSLVEGQEGWEPATPEAGPSYCFYCGGVPDEQGRSDRFTFRHKPDCSWLKLRAFLAQ